MVSHAALALLLCTLNTLALSPVLAQSNPERFISEPELAKDAKVRLSPRPVGVEMLRPQSGLVPVQPIPIAPAPPKGWCCLRGQPFASSAPTCHGRGGQFFNLRHDAERRCQSQRPAQPWAGQQPAPLLRPPAYPAAPPQRPPAYPLTPPPFPDGLPPERLHESPPEEAFGTCCLHGDVFPAPEFDCRDAGGGFFRDPRLARRECRPGSEPPREGRPPPQGWCCRTGEVFPTPEFECREIDGVFFQDPERAHHECRSAQRPPEGSLGTCCLHGDVIHTSEHECSEAGGGFFRDPELAQSLRAQSAPCPTAGAVKTAGSSRQRFENAKENTVTF